MRQLAIENALLQVTKCRTHALHTLAKFNPAVLKRLLGETGLQQPGFQVPKIPAVEPDLLNAIAVEQLAQLVRNELIGYRLARRRAKIAARRPQIIRHMIGLRALPQPVLW